MQFSYNISRLMELDRQRDAMFQARLYADEYLANTGERLAIRPYVCGNVCCCCARCGCVEVREWGEGRRELGRELEELGGGEDGLYEKGWERMGLK